MSAGNWAEFCLSGLPPVARRISISGFTVFLTRQHAKAVAQATFLAAVLGARQHTQTVTQTAIFLAKQNVGHFAKAVAQRAIGFAKGLARGFAKTVAHL